MLWLSITLTNGQLGINFVDVAPLTCVFSLCDISARESLNPNIVLTKMPSSLPIISELVFFFFFEFLLQLLTHTLLLYLIALYITKGENFPSASLFVLTLFPLSRLFYFFESFSGSEFVFASFGILGLFKLLLRIQLLEILLGFKV